MSVVPRDARLRFVASGGRCAVCGCDAIDTRYESAMRSRGVVEPGDNGPHFTVLAYTVEMRACFGVYRDHFNRAQSGLGTEGHRIGTFCVRCIRAAQNAVPEQALDVPQVVNVPVVITPGQPSIGFDRILELMLAELRRDAAAVG